MNSFDAQAIPVPSTVRRPLPSPRLAAAAFLLAAAIAVVMTWGEGWAVHSGLAAGVPTFRYVNSGWIAPLDAREAGAFSEELRAFVILNQEELDAFEDGYVGKVTRGNATALGRIDFDRGVLLGAYYIWRPVQGDPLAVAGVRPKGSRTLVDLELSYDPQGREYPYMYAPMVMVTVDRSLFPEDEPVDFEFRLNGEPVATLTATPN